MVDVVLANVFASKKLQITTNFASVWKAEVNKLLFWKPVWFFSYPQCVRLFLLLLTVRQLLPTITLIYCDSQTSENFLTVACCSLAPSFVTAKGVRKGGWGYPPPLSLIFYEKHYYLRKEDYCFRILFACQFVGLMQIPRNEFAGRFQGTL